ncbi:hypothetical protein EYF80_038619 [Liparis tanakae]|uniref:Uncharacterized protein n=1 Tax=Liparis tanakae TaxID=230148 RepID=A0A4Z2GDC3_9TELE|nr:hypothetical protein EYF80_038619 [Liparis tanakae]
MATLRSTACRQNNMLKSLRPLFLSEEPAFFVNSLLREEQEEEKEEKEEEEEEEEELPFAAQTSRTKKKTLQRPMKESCTEWLPVSAVLCHCWLTEWLSERLQTAALEPNRLPDTVDASLKVFVLHYQVLIVIVSHTQAVSSDRRITEKGDEELLQSKEWTRRQRRANQRKSAVHSGTGRCQIC